VRNWFSRIPSTILSTIVFKTTSSIVVVPIVLILVFVVFILDFLREAAESLSLLPSLCSCILTIRRNSYRTASIELYKLLCSVSDRIKYSNELHSFSCVSLPVTQNASIRREKSSNYDKHAVNSQHHVFAHIENIPNAE
jgi:hypothetical protein